MTPRLYKGNYNEYTQLQDAEGFLLLTPAEEILAVLSKTVPGGIVGNGAGALPDCISCTVTEERNGAYELELVYPVDGQHYGELALREIIAAQPNPTADEQLFRIYRISRPLGGQVTVNAAHISYDLGGIPVSPFTAGSAAGALAGLAANAAVDCPFSFWTDVTAAGNFAVAVPASIRSLLGGSEGSVLDVYGGEYEWDNHTVRLHANRGRNRGVSIRYGKNLTDLTQEENCASVYTGVYPYWSDSDGNLIVLPEKILPAPGHYDFVRILALDLSEKWQEAPTAEQLRSQAEKYMRANAIGVPKVSLQLSFVQMEQTEEYKNAALLERVELCDTVQVSFPRLGVSALAKVCKTVYNVLMDRYDRVELGDAKTNLADTIVGQAEAIKNPPIKSFLEKAIDRATAQITGNLGGYVILHSSTGGSEPDEILIMDKPDIAEATKVWRWNKAGLGYSSNGYNGPFGLAMTQDGQIVADYIATGTLDAGIISAGVLKSLDGKTFYLDLEAGVLRMNATELRIAGKTVSDAAITGMTQKQVFDRLTDDGALQGLYMSDGKLYINAAWLDAGIINHKNSFWNLATGEFRSGPDASNRVEMDANHIKWFGGSATTGGMGAGVIQNGLATSQEGDTCVIGADTRYQKYGWYHDGQFQGLTLEQVDNEAMLTGKLSVGDKVSCRTLTAWDAKERVVHTAFGNLGLSAFETPQPTFADWGEGRCDKDGRCILIPDHRFSETVSASQRLTWILTALSEGGALWAENRREYTVIHGAPNQSFSWLCMSAQRGYEDRYAEPSDAKEPHNGPETEGWLLNLPDTTDRDAREGNDAMLKEERT